MPFQVVSGKVDLSIGGLGNTHFKHDWMEFYSHDFRFVTRNPVPINNYANVFRPLAPNIWLAFYVLLASFSTLFAIFYAVYGTKAFEGLNFRGTLVWKIDFVILPFSTLFEPDPIKWFPKESAGIFSTYVLKLNQVLPHLPCM